MNNREIACEAIRANKRIQLIYRGHTRKVEVHSVGVAENGKIMMLSYQVEGGSNGKKKVGWRRMNLNEVESIIILDEASEAPRSGYKGGVRGIIEVIAHVPAPHPEEEDTKSEAQAEALANALAQLKVQRRGQAQPQANTGL
jgi:hypothetical protein